MRKYHESPAGQELEALWDMGAGSSRNHEQLHVAYRWGQAGADEVWALPALPGSADGAG